MDTHPTSARDDKTAERARRGPQLSDDQAMALALEEAAAAVGHGDVPVGAVALVDGRLVASRHNEREQRGDPTAHAELLTLSDAATALGTWRLSEVTLVSRSSPVPCAPVGSWRRASGALFSVPPIPKRGRAGPSTTSARSAAQPRSQRDLRCQGS